MRKLILDEPDPYPNDLRVVQSPVSPTSPSQREKERFSRQMFADAMSTHGRESMTSTSDLEAGREATPERLGTVNEQSQSNTGDHEAELAGVIINALKTFRRRDDDNGTAPPAYAGEL
jgi:hypothetical protein